jgi:DNA-directed RNA polymerase subunit M/transcription elongation factor TFIIS
MKFCSECGSELLVGPTKFCHNCGTNLWYTINDSERREIEQPNIYSLGVKLEQMVEQILKTRGFSTERRLKLTGESGATHEIDVLAKRETDVLAVECKNYCEARTVGIKEPRDFQSKIQDLPQINHAMFIINIVDRFELYCLFQLSTNLIQLCIPSYR